MSDVLDQPHQLRALLHARAETAHQRALENGGAVPADELDELERLNRLIALLEDVRGPRRRKRWPVAAALGATLLVASILLFARVPATDIELAVITTEASFVLPTQQVFADVLDLSAVGAAGFSNATLPREIGTFEPADVTAIRVAAAANGERVGTVNLSGVVLPSETRVRIRSSSASRQYRLSFDARAFDIQIDVAGPTRVGTAAAPEAPVDFSIPRSIVLRSDSAVIDLDVTLLEGAAVAFSPLLDVGELSLFRVDDYPEHDRSVVRRVSAIQSGTLYLESLNGREYRLRTGQPLHFDRIVGQIRTLQLADDRISLQLHGRVHGMRTGAGSTDRSLMPTVLEWLHARHGASLLWGSTLYLFGLVAGVARWWSGRS